MTSEVGSVLPHAAHITQRAEQLIRKLVSVRSDNLRSRTAAEELRLCPPPEAVELLGYLMRARRERPAAAACVDAMARALAKEELDSEFVAAMQSLAQSRADRLVEALLASGPAARVYDHNEEPFVDRRLRQLSLGERRALSRSRDIDMLLRLAHDQDTRGVQGLRPTHAHVLEHVLASRFGQSRRVRQAVAHNPYAPVSLAVRAMASLTAPELDAIALDERVADEVRAHAGTLLVGRRVSPAEKEQATAWSETTQAVIDHWLTAQISERSIDPEDLDCVVVKHDDASD
jgi:hypothetical protein